MSELIKCNEEIFNTFGDPIAGLLCFFVFILPWRADPEVWFSNHSVNSAVDGLIIPKFSVIEWILDIDRHLFRSNNGFFLVYNYYEKMAMFMHWDWNFGIYLENMKISWHTFQVEELDLYFLSQKNTKFIFKYPWKIEMILKEDWTSVLKQSQPIPLGLGIGHFFRVGPS